MPVPRMKRIFRKISICFVFLSRINNGPIRPHGHHEGHGNHSHNEHKPKSNFRVASLCFLFLRRLHGFENHFHGCGNIPSHTIQIKRPKRNLTNSGKCPCCNLKTDSENGEEQTKTILTHFLRDIVPKFSRICIGQNPQSSSQIWTIDKKPKKWPSALAWKDPNNTPKDTLEVLQKKMSILMHLCDISKVPPEYFPELQAYREYCQELANKKETADISKLQILRQQRKKSHDLAQACRKFSEFVQHHGLPDKSPFLQKEIQKLSQVLHDANSTTNIASQFDEVYCAIANAEGTEKPPEEFMAQFASSSHAYAAAAAGDIYMATPGGSFRRDNAYSYMTNSQGSEFQEMFYARRPCEKRVFAETQNSRIIFNPMDGKRLKSCTQNVILDHGFTGSGFM